MVGDQEPLRGITEEIAMPGGRLTRQDRQQIALGLADSLPYAEIARRIGPHTIAATRLENVARFLDFIGESITRAAEQAREVLHAKLETPSNDAAQPSPDHG